MDTANETLRAASAEKSLEAAPLRLAYSVVETAEILGISEKTVRRLISRGLLRASHALRHLLIPRKEIERFLEDTTTS
jgi:excisionase family DNA binding protein